MLSTTTWRKGSAKNVDEGLKSVNTKEKVIVSVQNVPNILTVTKTQSGNRINECFCDTALNYI